ncbi:hypothetical protein GCM10009585_01100 [Brevibacterium paucivorans]|uniref:lytic transglycosylase domain-containing protein n=1 Tax=Brevibacterium paucivorans TaxID=170994 RepID=UPI0031E1865E
MGTGSKVFVALAGLLALGLLVGSGVVITKLSLQPESSQAASPQAPDPAPVPSADSLGESGDDPTAAPTADPAAVAKANLSLDWLDETSKKTNIPRRVLQAYVGATLWGAREHPSCNLNWNTLAAIGAVESNHGRLGGATIKDDGNADKDILGPQLNGQGFKRIEDTDNGSLDGDTEFDRAVGPMQFLPQTWRSMAKDGNGDKRADPNNIDDATVTAVAYLCKSGNVGTSVGWDKAIRSYNNSDDYVQKVFNTANNIARVAAPAPAPAPATVPANNGQRR